MDFKCRECQNLRKDIITTFTIELNEDGREFDSGYYRNAEYIDHKEGYWSYNYIDKNYKNPDKKEYDCICWNCQDYAKYLFNKL